VLVACQVQGEGAPESIVRAMRRIERYVALLTWCKPRQTSFLQ